MAHYFVYEEITPISIISGEFVAYRLLCTSSAEAKLGGHSFI